MFIGGYSIDMYCDCAECKEGVNSLLSTDYRSEEQGFYQVAGSSKRDAMADARKRGWKFIGDECYAPGHKIKKGAE